LGRSELVTPSLWYAPPKSVLSQVSRAPPGNAETRPRQPGLELIPVHTLTEESFCDGRASDAKPIRMEMDYDTGVLLANSQLCLKHP
jgi:hypothetical protein